MTVCGEFSFVTAVMQLGESSCGAEGGGRTPERPAAMDGGWAGHPEAEQEGEVSCIGEEQEKNRSKWSYLLRQYDKQNIEGQITQIILTASNF